MKKETLATIAICVGSAQAGASSEKIDLKDLTLTAEAKVDYEQFCKMTAKEVVAFGDIVLKGNTGNHPNTVLDGNHPNILLDANFPNTLLDGNYPQTMLDSNFPDTTLGNRITLKEFTEVLPGPRVEIERK